MVYYRVVGAVVSFLIAAALAITLLSVSDGGAQDFRALVIGLIATLAFGARLITSTHRHVINFEMPDQVLHWRSPAIDYKEKQEAANVIREFAGTRHSSRIREIVLLISAKRDGQCNVTA